MPDGESGKPARGFSFGVETTSRSSGGRSGRASLPSVGIFLAALATAAAIAVFAIVAQGGSSPDVRARATAICAGAQRELKSLSGSPTSIAEAMQTERSALAVYQREVSKLEPLGRSAGTAFRAGLADDRSLLASLSSMIARPDFIQLSLTLPGHPELVPTWLKEWLARSHALTNDAHAQFARAGVSACEKSLG